MVKSSFTDRLMIGTIYVLLSILAFVTFYPFWNALVISFNDGADTSLGGITFWPRVFSLENYEIVFRDESLLTSFWVSIKRTVIGTIASILVTSLLAYGLTKKELMGRKFYMIMLIFTLYFSGGLVPYFLVVQALGLFESFWVMVLPFVVNVWNMLIFRTFFRGLPDGLEEAAKIDGSGNWGIYFRIILPLSGPVIAALSLFTAVFHWNDWFQPSIFINDPNLIPISLKLKQILDSSIVTQNLENISSAAQSMINRNSGVTTKSLSMSTMMVATIPIVIAYIPVQKYFVKGVLIGSLKE
jgi:putative aldouronate transport system permease protein